MTREQTIMIVAAILRLRGGIDHIVEARELADQIEPPKPAGKYRYCLHALRGLERRQLDSGEYELWRITRYCGLPPNHTGNHKHLPERELI